MSIFDQALAEPEQAQGDIWDQALETKDVWDEALVDVAPSLTPETDQAVEHTKAKTQREEWLAWAEQKNKEHPFVTNAAGAAGKLVKALPEFAAQIPEFALAGAKIVTGQDRQGGVETLVEEAVPMGQSMAQGIQSPVGSEEWFGAVFQSALMAAPGLELVRGAKAKPTVSRPPVQEPVTTEPPPVQAKPQTAVEPRNAIVEPESQLMPVEAGLQGEVAKPETPIAQGESAVGGQRMAQPASSETPRFRILEGILPGGKPDLYSKAEYALGQDVLNGAVQEYRSLVGNDARISLSEQQRLASELSSGKSAPEAAREVRNEFQAHAEANKAVQQAIDSEQIESGPQAQALYEQVYNEQKGKPSQPPSQVPAASPTDVLPPQTEIPPLISETTGQPIPRNAVGVTDAIDIVQRRNAPEPVNPVRTGEFAEPRYTAIEPKPSVTVGAERIESAMQSAKYIDDPVRRAEVDGAGVYHSKTREINLPTDLDLTNPSRVFLKAHEEAHHIWDGLQNVTASESIKANPAALAEFLQTSAAKSQVIRNKSDLSNTATIDWIEAIPDVWGEIKAKGLKLPALEKWLNDIVPDKNLAIQPPKLGVSKIGQSIEAKAVEAKLTKGFGETAGFDPITIADQAARATNFVQSAPLEARAVVRGEKPLPPQLRGTSLITAMEEQLLRKPDPQLAYELANSPLTSATSAAAQEMRLMAERVPDSITSKFQEIRAAREAGSKLRGETPQKVVGEIQAEVAKNSSKRPTWEAFVKSLECV